MDALTIAIAELRDECLLAVWVAGVFPAPNAGRLRVVLEAPAGGDVNAIERAIEANAKSLRWEVANAIHRKRAPILTFVVLSASVDEGP